MKFPHLQATQTRLNLLLSLYFAAVLNMPLYVKTLHLHPFTGAGTDYFLFTVPLVIFSGCLIIFTLFAQPFVHKIIVPLLLVVSAAISYNSLFFDVYFNRDMLTNVLITTVSESRQLMTLPFVSWVLGLGVLPAVLYCMTRIHYRTWWREILWRLGSLAFAVLLPMGIAAVFYQDYASFGRNNPTIVHLIVPTNFISAGVSKYRHWRREQIPYEIVDKDARQEKPDNYRHVTVLVLGETTRAQNWGLNGYSHQTTPLLAARGDSIINFRQVTSCNTFTAGSVPCMLSDMGRSHFDSARAARRDNLLNILQRAGINVQWLDNDTGCKGACSNIPFRDLTALQLPQFCKNGECLDNIMLPDLDKILAQVDVSKKDTFIVLHTIGSHGPTYYERYTPDLRRFTPTCDTNEINRCSNAQLVNTYDNTILYVDQFINAVISRLEQHKNWESTLLYVSDHGESLGEKGVYLHGTPYAIAPQEQTRVPMIMWFSPMFRQNEHIDFACLQRNAQTQNFSHDNIYSTLYGTMDMHTANTSYQAAQDILAACRK